VLEPCEHAINLEPTTDIALDSPHAG
jgi:hypothetical protein